MWQHRVQSHALRVPSCPATRCALRPGRMWQWGPCESGPRAPHASCAPMTTPHLYPQLERNGQAPDALSPAQRQLQHVLMVLLRGVSGRGAGIQRHVWCIRCITAEGGECQSWSASDCGRGAMRSAAGRFSSGVAGREGSASANHMLRVHRMSACHAAMA